MRIGLGCDNLATLGFDASNQFNRPGADRSAMRRIGQGS